MIDISTETLISLSQAARETPNRNGGRGVNVATIWRWKTRGISGVVLDITYVGGQLLTSREAMQRFFAAVNTARSSKQPSVTTSKSREAAIERANRELDAAGI